MDVQAFRSQILSLALLLMIYLSQCTTGRRLRRPCRETINIMSRAGVKIEPHPKSHVKLALGDELNPNNNSEFRLSFAFQTPSANGVLFYGRTRNQREMIALTLQGGDIMYKIRCGSLHVDALVPKQDNSLLNDSAWHTVEFKLESRPNNKEGRIQIDGNNLTVRPYLVSCGALTTLVMGGYSEEDSENIHGLENLKGHFNGCIRNVFTPTPLSHLPKYYAFSSCQ